MDRGTRYVVGWLVGIVAYALFTFWVVDYSESRHHNNVIQARTNTHWVVRTGILTNRQPPDFSSDPPLIKADIDYRDFYGQEQTVSGTQFPYKYERIPKVQIDASDTGSVYVPAAGENQPNGSLQGNPFVTGGFWPVAGIVLGILISAGAAFLIGLITAWFMQSIYEYKGRLGTN